MLKLDTAEIATIKAALKYYLEEGQGEPNNRDDEIHDIATCGGDDTSLDHEGIEDLFSRIEPLESGFYLESDEEEEPNIVHAARSVLENWSGGDLARSVNMLEEALESCS